MRLWHVFQAIGLVIYAVYILSAIRNGTLKGGRRWAALVALGCFVLAVVANSLGW